MNANIWFTFTMCREPYLAHFFFLSFLLECVWVCVLALYLQPNPFFALVFSFLWLLCCECFMHYTLAVIASGYSILIRSHSLLSVCTKFYRNICQIGFSNEFAHTIKCFRKRTQERTRTHTHANAHSEWQRRSTRTETNVRNANLIRIFVNICALVELSHFD